MNPVTRVDDLGHGTTAAIAAVIDIETATTIAVKEREMSLLEVELSRERIRDLEREIRLDSLTAARVRAVRRARRDARVRALRLRSILLSR